MTVVASGILVERPRISSVDIMRGIVMVIMALDHVRDFYHADALVFDPTDMTKTSPALFFTRWITHFCAPTFVLLSGVAVRISEQRKTKKELSIYLLTRGLWLILLELTVVRFSFFFNLYYDSVIFQVIWVIGASMVTMAALVFLNERIIVALGLVLIFGHNIFDLFPMKPEDAGYALMAFLRNTGFLSTSNGSLLMVMYPLLPWLGIMLAGYGLGGLYISGFDVDRRKKLLLIYGAVAVLLFIVIRFTNQYGDPAPWSVQKNSMFTVMSFLNCTKYPVSLSYTLMTLGPVLLVLPWLEKLNARSVEPLVVFGRVPLFYYVVHFFLIHGSALLIYIANGQLDLGTLDFHFNKSFGGLVPGAVGFSLGWAYVAWIIIVAVLYPVCKWYNNYKAGSRSWWVSYV